MRYAHIVAYVASQVWAIAPEKMAELLDVLAFRASGQAFTPEEIEARLGAKAPAVPAGRGVGVLPVRGIIAHRMGSLDESSGGISCERLGAMLDQLVADPNVGTILLDVDSPGGTVVGVPELADKVYAARQHKRIVALVNGLAASAAYWIASQADEVVSIPSGFTGSIGVYTVHADLSEKLAKEGISMSVISAGKHKVDGQPFQPLSDEHKAYLQALVDESYGQFVAAVARGRGVSAADVRGGFGEGRVLRGKEAKAAGLIDRIATVEDTLARLLRGGGSVAMGARAEDDTPAVAAALPDEGLTDDESDRRRRWRFV